MADTTVRVSGGIVGRVGAWWRSQNPGTPIADMTLPAAFRDWLASRVTEVLHPIDVAEARDDTAVEEATAAYDRAVLALRDAVATRDKAMQNVPTRDVVDGAIT